MNAAPNSNAPHSLRGLGRCRNKCGIQWMEQEYYVYILSNQRHTVFYTGVTNNLIKRTYEHKMKFVEGFTKKYHIEKLLYFESTPDLLAARHRERLIKKWKRSIKFDAINTQNPDWKDLYFDLITANSEIIAQ